MIADHRLAAAVVTALLACAGCATPGESFHMSAETVAYCKAGGGCHPITIPDLLETADAAFMQGYSAGAAHGFAVGQGQACKKAGSL